MPEERALLTLSGTYTLDPIAGVVDFWSELLGLNLATEVTPYGQLFQQLLDPGSALRRNRAGANIVCLRHEDLIPRGHEKGGAQAIVQLDTRLAEVASALLSVEHVLPCLVLIGPSVDPNPSLSIAYEGFAASLQGVPNLFIEQGARAMERYAVSVVHDAASDRFGHVPFTTEAVAAMGTTIARWYAAMVRTPVKVVAVDADHTLWSGVVGENGADGVRIDEPYRVLQRALVEQERCGRLVCLLSKNEEADVRAVFASRPEMVLQWSDLVAHRVDWNPKPGNLRDLMSGLELGIDSALFLDDNPVECAQMRAECPTVLTVRVPVEPDQLESFSEHLWLFDQPRVTAEDQGRAGKYRDNASRAELRRSTESLQAFLDGLGLVVDMEDPASEEIPRLSQLTQRTNQFNASLLRLGEAEVRLAGVEGGLHQMVRARDRFGDYGVVGQMRAHPQGGTLNVDLFMLSCRALGRGIEHRMLAAVGRHAQQLGLDDVAVHFRLGERNAPVRKFLEHAFDHVAAGDDFWFRMPAARAASIVFDTSGSECPEQSAVDAVPADSAKPAPPNEDLGSLYERIAHGLTTAVAIEQAMALRIRPRPEVGNGFIAPAAGMENDIASIWRQVLRMESIGSNDLFHELGGKSIHLVHVHRLLLDRLHVDVDIVTLFQYPTVAMLAAHLAARSVRGNMGAAQERGMRMREARARSRNNSGDKA